MENMQKFVTAQDIAATAGCSLCSVRLALSHKPGRNPNLSAKLEEKILRTAYDLGYDPDKARRRGRPKSATPTIGDVAKAVGCSTSCANNVFLGTRNVSKELTERVLKKAEELGFVYHPRMKRGERIAFDAAEKERKFYLRYAGFKSKEEQNEYMEVMRTLGYSNAQISRKVGLTIQTVRRRIGPQPDDMSRDNRIAGMKHRAAENQRRRVYVDTHLVRTYNNLILECGQLREQAAELVTKADELTKEIIKMKPEVDKAKLSTEKPEELPVEQLQMPIATATSSVLQ